MSKFDWAKIPELYTKIIPSITVTLEYVVIAFFFGLLFGGLLAWAKLGKSKILRALAYGYTTVMRCVPAIVLLFVVYYGLPRIMPIDTKGKVKFVAITLALFTTGSLSEAFRSAYQSLDKSQAEAAKSIGMTGPQALWFILLPQMIRIAIPNICNSLLALVKEGALAYTIGLYDLLGRGNYLIGKNLGAYVIETYVTLVIIYWPISLLITFGSKRLEALLDVSSRKERKRSAHA
ncbi:MAG: amino acid ABC transporter permease [Lachnospiraceae bacterium]|nr:amino acid ABC transporter permease [Lachnospiraceae bacterium]